MAIGALILALKSKAPLASAVSMVCSGILMVGAWVMEIGHTYAWQSAIRAYVAEATVVTTPYLAGFNMLLFGLSIIYFFSDIFDIYKNESEGLGDVRPLGGKV